MHVSLACSLSLIAYHHVRLQCNPPLPRYLFSSFPSPIVTFTEWTCTLTGLPATPTSVLPGLEQPLPCSHFIDPRAFFGLSRSNLPSGHRPRSRLPSSSTSTTQRSKPDVRWAEWTCLRRRWVWHEWHVRNGRCTQREWIGWREECRRDDCGEWE